MSAGTVEKSKAGSGSSLTVKEMRAQKAEREAAEKAAAEKAAAESDRAAIDAAHEALGTGIDGGIDNGPQDVHAGGDDDDAPAGGQLSFAVGGKRPTVSGLRLVGGKVDVEGSFAKGQKIVFRVEAEVGEIAFIDQHDPKTRQVIGCERRHKARIVGVNVIES